MKAWKGPSNRLARIVVAGSSAKSFRQQRDGDGDDDDGNGGVVALSGVERSNAVRLLIMIGY